MDTTTTEALLTEKSISVPSADIYIRPDGIMHVHIKIEDEFRIENSMEIVKSRTKIANGKPYPIMYTATKYVTPSQEVREYVASEDRSELVTADAFVINTPFQRFFGKLYKKLNKPVRPTSIFETEEEAVEWLQQYVPKAVEA